MFRGTFDACRTITSKGGSIVPDRVRNGLVKVERSVKRLPGPLRSLGLWFTGSFTRLLGSITGAETKTPVIGLTFDDGPDPVVTPQVLEALADHGARATFFMLSERAEEYPEAARSVVAAGHEVALHGANHDNLTQLAMGQVRDRVSGGRRRLEAVVGEPVRQFRPPYGAQTIRSFLTARRSRMQVVMWSADPNDWDDIATEQIVQRALDTVKPGGILLLHDGWTPDPAGDGSRPESDRASVVRMILEGVTGAGMQPVTVSELLDGKHPTKRVWFESG
jgi:peptidoglycan/xylan/chitin deacetylase (PgdA/CDA1 family)